VGESQNQPFQLSFNASLRVDFQGSRVTSDGGLILIRELDERLGFGELIEQYLTGSRAKNARLPFADLLRQSVYGRLAGYEDVNDAERLSRPDLPAGRLRKIWDRGLALTSRLQTFEIEMLAEEENFAGLARLNRALIGRAEAIDSGDRAVLDLDGEADWGGQNQHSGSAERPKRAALLPQRGEGDLRLTRRATRARLSGEGEAQNGNSSKKEEPMRRHIGRLVAVIAFTLLFSLVTEGTAQGQQTCSNASLHGSYGLHATGITGAGGNFAAVGRFTFDGKGNLTGTLFVRVAGNNVQVNITGTYSVSADCIVDDTWNASGGGSSTHKSVIVKQGRAYFILNNTSGDGSVISGEAKRQFPKNEDED